MSSSNFDHFFCCCLVFKLLLGPKLIDPFKLSSLKDVIFFWFWPENFSLHYANVSVGTPRTSYLVALDTGSDYLWLPCDCISCVKGFNTSDGEVILIDLV